MGKVAVVTGASRGIGLATAEAFIKAGAEVVLVSRDEAVLAQVQQRLGEKSSYLAVNMGHIEDVGKVVDYVMTKYTKVDILVNNAAANPYFGNLADMGLTLEQKTLDVNLLGPFELIKLFYNSYMKDNGGNIINVASVGGLQVEWNIGFYNVTKAALIHMTRQLGAEMGPKVRVNAIAPGLVKTKLAQILWEDNESEIAQRLPLKRIGIPEDIANIALFLASDLSSWMTGQVIVVDGGASIIPAGGVG